VVLWHSWVSMEICGLMSFLGEHGDLWFNVILVFDFTKLVLILTCMVGLATG
jgi:hypothetical protein